MFTPSASCKQYLLHLRYTAESSLYWISMIHSAIGQARPHQFEKNGTNRQITRNLINIISVYVFFHPREALGISLYWAFSTRPSEDMPAYLKERILDSVDAYTFHICDALNFFHYFQDFQHLCWSWLGYVSKNASILVSWSVVTSYGSDVLMTCSVVYSGVLVSCSVVTSYVRISCYVVTSDVLVACSVVPSDVLISWTTNEHCYNSIIEHVGLLWHMLRGPINVVPINVVSFSISLSYKNLCRNY